MSILDFNQQKQRNNVYLCGFLANRLHNEQLYAISRDLMLPFFVCANPSTYHKWNKKETFNLMSQCDVIVFWLNRYTLNDKNCLLSLQLAWELNLQVIMLRHPRMRLVVNPIAKLGTDQMDVDESSTPNMTFLQYAILEGYKQSIEYDRNSHSLSVQRLINKIFNILETKYASSTRESSPTSGSTDTYQETKEHLKLPNLSSVYSFSVPDQRRASSISHIMSRSRSQDNFKITNNLMQLPVPLTNGFSKLNQNNSKMQNVNRRNGSLPRIITLKKSRTMINEELYSSKKDGLDLPISSRNNFVGSTPDLKADSGALRSTNDPELYHSTQYLVFPLLSKSHKPRLIHFPNDIINKDTDVDLESLWGSDSSLADELDRASILQGDLFIRSPPSRSPLATPAPYIEPI